MKALIWFGIFLLGFGISMGFLYYEVAEDHRYGEGPLTEKGAVVFGVFCIVAALAAGVAAAVLISGSVFADW